ncbi:glycosyltransferase [Helicobacter sp.]|uniref:glycosyltransferase n=1 Tax=Helicobacter sp. TaxID=218 RepID=UPI001994E293|nr:glycosyltransferase [Helicobacter sp.]MBD5164239.1 glycosyltransferase [Helicobacter sp.]
MNKLVSVVLPTYNGEKYLRQSIESVLNQSYENLELILVNDCSSDDTQSIISEYAKQDKRVVSIINSQNYKLPKSLNVGFREAKGEYYTWTSDDNYYQQNAIEEMVDYLESHQDKVAVCANYIYIDVIKGIEFEVITIPNDIERLIFDGNPCGACFLYRSSIAKQIGNYNEKQYLTEDYDFWLRMGLIGEIGHINRSLYSYRNHIDSLTSQKKLEIIQKTRILRHSYLQRYLQKFPYLKQAQKFKKAMIEEQMIELGQTRDMNLIEKINSQKEISKKVLYKLYKSFWEESLDAIYLEAIKRLSLFYRIKTLSKKIFKRIYLKKIVGCKCKHYLFGIRIGTSWNCNVKEIFNKITREVSEIHRGKFLVVIPSDKLEDYVKKGFNSLRLSTYYNPNGFFDKVFCLGIDEKFGMTIIGVSPKIYRKALEIIKPVCVRAYGGYWATTFAVSHRVNGIPVVCSVHDTNPSLLYKEICGADKVIVMSKAVATLCLNRGVQESKIEILPNRVDISKFYPQKIMNLENFSKNFKWILYIGRLAEQKNLDTLLQAFSLLPDEYRLLIVGRGEASKYQLLSESLGVQKRIVWKEAITNEELPKYYNFMDCFCVPSRWEGFGIVFIEAAACGMPIVTSNISPMNEFLTHNVSAYLVDDYENPKALSEAILAVCENKNYAEVLKKGAVQVASKFAKEKIDAQEAEIYSRIKDKNAAKS